MALDGSLRFRQIENVQACIHFLNAHPRQNFGLYVEVDIEDLDDATLRDLSVADTLLADLGTVITKRTGEVVTNVGQVMDAMGLTQDNLDELVCDCGQDEETTSSEYAAAMLTEHWHRLENPRS